jgi:hypothetical protein
MKMILAAITNKTRINSKSISSTKYFVGATPEISDLPQVMQVSFCKICVMLQIEVQLQDNARRVVNVFQDNNK